MVLGGHPGEKPSWLREALQGGRLRALPRCNGKGGTSMKPCIQSALPENWEAAREIHSVANDIRLQLADQLSALAISGALKFTAWEPRRRKSGGRAQVSTASGHLRNKEPLEGPALLKVIEHKTHEASS